MCLEVGGTALVKMTQPIWDLDHLPNLRLGATRVTSATRGRQAKPFPLKASSKVRQDCPFPTGNRGPSPKHRSIRMLPIRVAGTPGRICFQIPAQAPTIPAPHHRDMWAEGEGRRERRPVGCGCGWAMGQAWNQAMTLACRPRRRPRKAGKLFQGLPQVLGGLAGLAGPGVVVWNRP